MHGEGLGDAFLDDLAIQMTELPEVIIVLEDLHHLSNAALISDLARLSELLPRNVHLVLSSRADLPIAWSRQRMRLDVMEIRQVDLAFDDTDSAELLERITGQSFSADSVTALVNRTEGWAAGLQLAGMTLRLHEDPDDFVTQFSGTDRLIADYLSEEVLQAQSADRRQLLLQMSVPDEMNADLIGSLTGTPNVARHSRGVGAGIHVPRAPRLQPGVVPVPSPLPRPSALPASRRGPRARITPAPQGGGLASGPWGRRLGRRVPDVRAGLGRCARPDPARGSEVFERGEMATAIRWLSNIPEFVRADQHEVNLLLGLLLGTEGQAAAAEDVMRRVRTDPTASRGEAACAQVFLASLAQFRANHEMSIDMAEEALVMLDDLSDDEPMPAVMNLGDIDSLRTMALVSGGRAHFLAGHLDEARTWLKSGLASTGAAYSIWRVSGLGSLALVEAWSGNTERAETLADEALAVAQSVGMLAHPSTADAYLAITLAALERGEPRRAAISLHEGTRRAEANRRTQLAWVAHLELALLRAAEGEFDQSAAVLTSSAPSGRTTSTHCRRAPPSPRSPPPSSPRLPRRRPRGFLNAATRDSEILRFERVAVSLSTGQPDHRPQADGCRSIRHGAGQSRRRPQSRAPTGLGVERGRAPPTPPSCIFSTPWKLGGRHSLVEIFVQAGPAIVQLVRRASRRPDRLSGDHPPSLSRARAPRARVRTWSTR